MVVRNKEKAKRKLARVEVTCCHSNQLTTEGGVELSIQRMTLEMFPFMVLQYMCIYINVLRRK